MHGRTEGVKWKQNRQPDCEQQEMETKEAVEFEQSEEVNQAEKVNAPDDSDVGNTLIGNA